MINYLSPDMIEFVKDMSDMLSFLVYLTIAIPITLGIFKIITLSRRARS